MFHLEKPARATPSAARNIKWLKRAFNNRLLKVMSFVQSRSWRTSWSGQCHLSTSGTDVLAGSTLTDMWDFAYLHVAGGTQTTKHDADFQILQ